MTVSLPLTPSIPVHDAASFSEWRRRLDRDRVAPVIAVAGSRGKTSIVRAVESIFSVEGLRYASWTNRGVEIEGEGQRGEIGPWARTLTRLKAGGLDAALLELDWATLQTMGSTNDAYPIVAVANLCGNSEACLATPESALARKALARVRAHLPESGKLILNAHDLDLSESQFDLAPDKVLVGARAGAPILRRHLANGGNACFVEQSTIVIHEGGFSERVVALDDLGWTRDGSIPFAVQNALFATAIARSCGIRHASIAAGLASHVAKPELMPGSFNLFECDGATVIVDRPMPSWFLRPAIRAALNLGTGRQVRAIGPMLAIDSNDLVEVGRLLGRQSGVVIVSGDWQADRLVALRQGIALNEVPPLFMQASDERSAIQQGLDLIRAGDVFFVLAEHPIAAVRLISGRMRRRPCAMQPTAGAA